jgi:hypothetical protein
MSKDSWAVVGMTVACSSVFATNVVSGILLLIAGLIICGIAGK